MNFFKLYIGDYQRDTAHLSVTEHGAYMLMLQHYYATERPLPTGAALHRMLRAMGKAERAAIDAVAAQFWRETPEGLVNDRAAIEICKADHQRSVNRNVGKKGGRPRQTGTEQETDSVSVRKTESVSEPEPNDNPNQTPDTRQEIKTRTATDTGVARAPLPAQQAAPPHGENPQPGKAAPEPTAAGRACRLMRTAGLAECNPGHPELAALLAAGASEEELVGAARQAMAKGKGFAYALAIAAGQRQDAAARGPLHAGPLPAAAPAETAYQRSMRERVAAIHPAIAAKPPTAPQALQPAEVIDAADATPTAAIRLG